MSVPFVEVSLREKPSGGGIRNTLEMKGGSLRHVRDVTLFIHGFNVNLHDAKKVYGEFCSLIPLEKKRDHLWWLYWPGDYSKNKLLSVFFYSDIPERAENCARDIGRHLTKIAQETGGRINLRIVAHSMGCRLALELVDRISNTSEINIVLVALMAAAVPRYMIGRHKLLDLDVIKEGTRVLVFFSRSDSVLKFAFRPGQALERPSLTGFFKDRGAVGRFGFHLNAEQVNRRQVSMHEEEGAGHSDYWRSSRVAHKVAQELPGYTSW